MCVEGGWGGAVSERRRVLARLPRTHTPSHRHQHHPPSEEEEDPVLHGAQHGEEGLACIRGGVGEAQGGRRVGWVEPGGQLWRAALRAPPVSQACSSQQRQQREDHTPSTRAARAALGADSPTTKEKRKLMVTAALMPAALVSSVWISEGTSQPRGPHDLGGWVSGWVGGWVGCGVVRCGAGEPKCAGRAQPASQAALPLPPTTARWARLLTRQSLQQRRR